DRDALHSVPTRRSPDLAALESRQTLLAVLGGFGGHRAQEPLLPLLAEQREAVTQQRVGELGIPAREHLEPGLGRGVGPPRSAARSEEHTSELQSRENLV